MRIFETNVLKDLGFLPVLEGELYELTLPYGTVVIKKWEDEGYETAWIYPDPEKQPLIVKWVCYHDSIIHLLQEWIKTGG